MHEVTEARRGVGPAQARRNLGSGPLDHGLPGCGEPPRHGPTMHAVADGQLVDAQMVDELVPEQIPLSSGQLADGDFEPLLQQVGGDVTAKSKLRILEDVAKRCLPNVFVARAPSSLPTQIVEGESDSAHAYERGEVSSACGQNNRGWSVVSGDEQSMTKPLHHLLDHIGVLQHLLCGTTCTPKVASFEPRQRPAVAGDASDRQADFDQVVERGVASKPADRQQEQVRRDLEVWTLRANGLERSGGQHVQTIRAPIPGDSRQ